MLSLGDIKSQFSRKCQRCHSLSVTCIDASGGETPQNQLQHNSSTSTASTQLAHASVHNSERFHPSVRSHDSHRSRQAEQVTFEEKSHDTSWSSSLLTLSTQTRDTIDGCTSVSNCSDAAMTYVRHLWCSLQHR